MDTRSTAEHLDTLGILFYVAGGFGVLVGLFPIIHLVMGIAMVTGALPDTSGDEAAQVMGWVFVGVAVGLIVFLQAMAVVQILAGRALRRRSSLKAAQILSGISCVNMPFGTILGVLALVALGKPEGRALFAGATLDPPPFEARH